jgi:hypothetical protein
MNIVDSSGWLTYFADEPNAMLVWDRALFNNLSDIIWERGCR